MKMKRKIKTLLQGFGISSGVTVGIGMFELWWFATYWERVVSATKEGWTAAVVIALVYRMLFNCGWFIVGAGCGQAFFSARRDESFLEAIFHIPYSDEFPDPLLFDITVRLRALAWWD